MLALLTHAAFAAECSVASGWTLLFDGHTTTGWSEITGAAFPPSWTVEDRALKTIAGLSAFQDIRTADTFTSFEFAFEWKIAPHGNSGVKYRIERVDKWKSRTGKGDHARARGPEYQLVDDAANQDALVGPTRQTAALYGKMAPAPGHNRPAGEWNESRLVVRGNHVEHWLNGALVLSFEAPEAATASPIVLQNHDSEAWFRCLKVRRYDQLEPITGTTVLKTNNSVQNQ